MPKVETITIQDIEIESMTIRRRSGVDENNNEVHQVIISSVVNIIDDNGAVVRQENHSNTMKVSGNNPNRSTRWTNQQIRTAFNKTFDDLVATLRETKAGIART